MGLGLAQSEGQAVPGLPRIGLLRAEDKEPLVFPLRHDAGGAAAALPVAHRAFPGLVWWIEHGLGRRKGWQHTRHLFGRQAGRDQKLSRSVFEGPIGQHPASRHYPR